MNKELEKELDQMENSLTAATEPPGTEAPGTTAPGTEAPGTTAPSTEAPGTEAPTTEAPAEDELTKLRRTVESLSTTISELKKGTVPKTSAPKTSAPKTKAPSTDAPIKDERFVTEDDLDELTRDADKFNKLLNKVLMKGVTIGEGRRKKADETIIRSIPEIVKKNLETITTLKELSTKFYEDNEDLKPFKKAVSVVFEDVLSKNPDKKYEELMPIVATETRKALELHKKANVKKDDKGNPPNLPRKKGQQRQTPHKPETGSLLSELDEMDKSLQT